MVHPLRYALSSRRWSIRYVIWFFIVNSPPSAVQYLPLNHQLSIPCIIWLSMVHFLRYAVVDGLLIGHLAPAKSVYQLTRLRNPSVNLSMSQFESNRVRLSFLRKRSLKVNPLRFCPITCFTTVALNQSPWSGSRRGPWAVIKKNQLMVFELWVECSIMLSAASILVTKRILGLRCICGKDPRNAKGWEPHVLQLCIFFILFTQSNSEKHDIDDPNGRHKSVGYDRID